MKPFFRFSVLIHLEDGNHLPNWQLRQQIIPMLETAGLITQDPDPNDKRKILIYPTIPRTTSKEQNNSELRGGVNNVEE